MGGVTPCALPMVGDPSPGAPSQHADATTPPPLPGLGIALGNGAQADSATPVEVAGGHAFTRIAAGGQHTCGIRGNDGKMLCW